MKVVSLGSIITYCSEFWHWFLWGDETYSKGAKKKGQINAGSLPVRSTRERYISPKRKLLSLDITDQLHQLLYF